MNQAAPLRPPAPDAAPHPAPESDPGLSAFVSAHAGAGKTTLLVERLLRLMLSGADPAGILCLTYTKAAAAEMAIRLQRRLGDLVVLGDGALAARLRGLGVRADREAMARARGLFARVLELPGGMHIETIHAFCQSLLRRFPLEAQVSPHFSVLQDLEAEAARRTAREAGIADADPAALETLAGLVEANGFAALFGALLGEAERLDAVLALAAPARRAAIRRAAGCRAESAEAAIEAALEWPQAQSLAAALSIAARDGSQGVAAKAQDLLGWLALDRDGRRAGWSGWLNHHFRKDGQKVAASKFCNEVLARTRPEIAAACEAEQARLEAVLAELAAQRCAEATEALLAVAAPAVARYAREKGAAQLDFDDLIARSARLLVEPGAAWVLYKLDARLDHLLIDEAQDTAPSQWRIAKALTDEFFAGTGAREDAARTLFAVGDRKQSIYSFQGADPEQFAHWQTAYGRRVRQAGLVWLEGALERSWRSTGPVLRLVDAVFADPEAARGVCAPGELRHQGMREGQAGRVELWPLAPRPESLTPDLWPAPETNRRRESAVAALVQHLAGWIETELRQGRLESAGRKLAPHDILILVRKRSEIARALVGALKARGIPVAGLDRLALTEQPAVRDLLSLCEALLLPEDDLKVAEYLTSPLGGLDDDGLMALAAGRTGTLAEALRARAPERADWGAAWARYAALRARVDYAGPYALLAEALGPQGGRARLLARLGPEAAEPLDELLNAALLHARAHPPSLQLFLHWLEQSGAEVKREAEAAGASVRIMTVHGAKGLEAPLVILPDTVSGLARGGALLWTEDPAGGGDVPLWSPAREALGSGALAARARKAAREAEEENRLLYVALTRARDRLVICGATPGKPQPQSWYAMIRRGLERAGARPLAHPWGEGLCLESPQLAAPDTADAVRHAAAVALPAWLGRAPDWRHAPPPPEPRRPVPLAPSRPEGIEQGPVPAARSPLAGGGKRYARGRLIHALLQRLPELPEPEREGAARRFAPEVADEVMAVLRDPALAALFGPGSRAEQPVAGMVGDRVIAGQVDRLAVLPDLVLVADYKTGRAPPPAPERVPAAYVRQMAAYRAVLAGIYPERRIACCLVFTEGPAPVWLPPAMLDAAAAWLAGEA